jgi:hypothetical protein
MYWQNTGLEKLISAVVRYQLWFGAGRNSVGILVVNLYFYFFIRPQFRAGQSTMPCLHKALPVGRNAIGQTCNHRQAEWTIK